MSGQRYDRASLLVNGKPSGEVTNVEITERGPITIDDIRRAVEKLPPAPPVLVIDVGLLDEHHDLARRLAEVSGVGGGVRVMPRGWLPPPRAFEIDPLLFAPLDIMPPMSPIVLAPLVGERYVTGPVDTVGGALAMAQRHRKLRRRARRQERCRRALEQRWHAAWERWNALLPDKNGAWAKAPEWRRLKRRVERAYDRQEHALRRLGEGG